MTGKFYWTAVRGGIRQRTMPTANTHPDQNQARGHAQHHRERREAAECLREAGSDRRDAARDRDHRQPRSIEAAVDEGDTEEHRTDAETETLFRNH